MDRNRVAELGFDVIQLLDSTLTARAIEILHEEEVALDEPFFASPAHAWGTSANAIHTRLRGLLIERLSALLPDFYPFMIAVTAKGARNGSEIKFHHDWTYTDERVHQPLFMWCPLVDCGSETGSLRVVPGSHRWSGGIRPSRRIEVTESYQAEYALRSVGPVMRAGHAIVFHPALLHGSGPNPTPTSRPAITIASAPLGADLVHFHFSESGTLSGHLVEEQFFTMHPYGERPAQHAPYAPWTDIVSWEDMDPSAHDVPLPIHGLP